MMNAEHLIKELSLEKHPEGGYFRETYRADENLPEQFLSPRYGSDRSISTCIYFLLTKDSFSGLHRIASDEIFHFYAGDPVEMVRLFPSGEGERLALGADIEQGQLPQVAVERGTWQGARVAGAGEWALLGCTVAPGFDFADFEMGEREALLNAYPEWRDVIVGFTRS